MPNWCEGVLKVRGTKQNVLNYLQELLEVPSYGLNGYSDHEIVFSDGWDEITFEIKNCDYFYLKGTRRAFIDTNKFEFYWYQNNPDEVDVATIPYFKQAWGIIPDNYTDLSKKHNVDLKIFGYEQGMEFTQELEIHKGVAVKCVEYKFDDYEWEVPFSHLGG